MAAEFLLPRTEGRPLTVRLERDAVVGRGTDAGLRISSRRVSRSHCHLRVDGAAVHVRDLGSRNGTFVNGEGVGEAEVEVPLGATLSIGGVTMKLVRAGDRAYRPDGAAMLAEVEQHSPEGELQDSPSGMVVGQESAEELSDESVLVTDSGMNLDDQAPRDVSDRPSPQERPPANRPEPSSEPDPTESEPTEAADPEAETEDAMQYVENPQTEVPIETASEEVGSVDDGSVEAEANAEPPGEETKAESAKPNPFAGDDANETLTDEDAAFDFLNDESDQASGPDSGDLATLPGADENDQSSFAGFGDADDEDDVDSSLLGFLNDSK